MWNEAFFFFLIIKKRASNLIISISPPSVEKEQPSVSRTSSEPLQYFVTFHAEPSGFNLVPP